MSVGFEDWKTWREIYNRLEELKTSIDKLTKALSSIGTDSLQMKIIAGYLNILDAPLGYFSKKYLAGKATNYILAEEPFIAEETSKSGTKSSTGYLDFEGVILSQAFDLDVEQNCKLEGRSVVQVKWEITGGTINIEAAYVRVKLQKVAVGGAVTTIAQVNTSSKTAKGTYTQTVDVSVPLTSFSDGEKIRLLLEIYVDVYASVAGQSVTCKLYFDTTAPDTYIIIPFSLEQWLP